MGKFKWELAAAICLGLIVFGLVLSLVLMLQGCAQVSYKPDTGEFTYARIGDQTIEGLEIVLSDGANLTLNKQESQIGDLVELIRLLAPVIAVP